MWPRERILSLVTNRKLFQVQYASRNFVLSMYIYLYTERRNVKEIVNVYTTDTNSVFVYINIKYASKRRQKIYTLFSRFQENFNLS